VTNASANIVVVNDDDVVAVDVVGVSVVVEEEEEEEEEAAVVAAKGNNEEDEEEQEADFGMRDAQQSTDCTQTTIHNSTNSMMGNKDRRMLSVSAEQC
jgi:hypothetical protein